MKDQDVVVSRKVGNRSNTAKRSEDGRKGRGQDAFSAKVTLSWKEIEARMDEIAARNTGGVVRFQQSALIFPRGGCKVG